MQLLDLVKDQLMVGVPLPWNVRDRSGNLLLAVGFVITSDARREALLERGVYVDAVEFAMVEAGRASEPVRPPSLYTLWDQLGLRLDRALRRHDEESEVGGFVARLDGLADELTKLVDRDGDIAIYLCVRQEQQRLFTYGLSHVLHTAVICSLIAGRLAWPAERVRSFVKAAMTMNISTLDLQGTLATQDKPVTEAQRAQIREHPTLSARMLEDAGVRDIEWLTAVQQHHEHAGGGGYPAGLAVVGEVAHALRHCDVFTAKISPRAHRGPLPTQQAARELLAEDKGGVVAGAVIKALGIYPPGDFVKLQSGELAVVVRRGASAKTPLAASITDRNGKPCVNTVERDTAKPEFAIVAVVPDKTLVARVAPERFYGLQEG